MKIKKLIQWYFHPNSKNDEKTWAWVNGIIGIYCGVVMCQCVYENRYKMALALYLMTLLNWGCCIWHIKKYNQYEK